MRFNESERTLILTCWAFRDEGQHGWTRRASGWLTVVPCNDGDEFGDYLEIVLTDQIDDLGHPCGDILGCDVLTADRIKRMTRRRRKTA